MISLIAAAAIAAAQPAPAPAPQGQMPAMQHDQHEGMKKDCCKDCCKDMEKEHSGDGMDGMTGHKEHDGR